MAELPLFYQSVTPLNRDHHRGLRLGTPARPFGFAEATHLVPALMTEFIAAARHLPIVFLPGAAQPTPVFLVGLRAGRNAFVDAAGAWTGGYSPAFVRRYPFIYGDFAGSAQPVVCIDTSCEALKTKTGAALFGPDGSETPLLLERVKFVHDYYRAAQRTDAMMRRIRDLDLLRAIKVEAKVGQGESTIVQGLFMVDEAKLAALPDESFLALRRDGVLPALYAHLFSLGSVERLRLAA